MPALPGGYEQHKTIDEYYKRLGPNAPINSLVEEVADNQANAHEALKFGNDSHLNSRWPTSRPGGANETAVPHQPADPQGGLAQGHRPT